MTRLALLEAIQKLLDDERTGLNKDHTVGELLNYLDDPKTTVGPLDHALDLVERARVDREKVVAFIKNRQEQIRHDDRDSAQALEILAWEIENGEHAKGEVGHGR